MLEANLCCNNPKSDQLGFVLGNETKADRKCLDLCPILTSADFCYKFHSALPHTTYYNQDDNQNCIRLIRRFVYDVFCLNILNFYYWKSEKKTIQMKLCLIQPFFFRRRKFSVPATTIEHTVVLLCRHTKMKQKTHRISTEVYSQQWTFNAYMHRIVL